MQAVTDSSILEQCQEALRKRLLALLPQLYKKDFIFQGKQNNATDRRLFNNVPVHYAPDIGLWYAYNELDAYHWNPFGLGDPALAARNLSIGLEINIPYKYNRRVNGIFVEDANGDIYLAHRGKLSGIKRAFFFDHYTGQKTAVHDCERQFVVALVTPLYDPALARNIKSFANSVAGIKQLYKMA
ncbi:MAG: hypothetical protein GXY32_02845 [Ruminococcaceae bacterium]|nr:hypothetical protein [Oscillospiraceae bacterium]